MEDLLLAEDLGLSNSAHRLVLQRVQTVESVLEFKPKSVAWRMRNLLGTRVRWYAEVEEADQ